MKKKLIFKVAAICMLAGFCFSNVQAQFAKGTVLVEGSVGNISIYKADYNYEYFNTIPSTMTKSDYKSFGFGLNPSAGIFLTNKLVIGTALNIYFSSSKSNSFNKNGIKSSDGKSSSASLGISPFVRYYFAGCKSQKTMFYGQVAGGVSTDLSNKSDYKYYNNAGVFTNSYKYNYPKKYFTYSAQVLLGLNHMLSQNVALNMGLGYSFSQNTQTSNYTITNSGGVSTTSSNTKYTNKYNNINWSLGFTMFIPRKKGK